MEQALGNALPDFDVALRRLHEALAAYPALAATVFNGTEEWEKLLTHKLVPHLAGEGCLVAAVTGGTNTGKSTVFNLLVGASISPVLPTAAATRHPLIAAGPVRAAQCLEAKLVPEFRPRALCDPQALVIDAGPQNTLFVAETCELSDRLILLDTPDVDSIEKSHWAVAESIRAAGDVLVAVITAEKYKDERVVSFFRQALASGRLVVPLMNKAGAEDDFAVARRQLDEFKHDVGLDAPCFVLPYHSAGVGLRAPIPSVDGAGDLRTYLESLDVPAIKRRVYRATVRHFVACAADFLDQAGAVGATLRNVADEFLGRTRVFASKYDPAPGAEVGGVFHEFVQSKRGPIRRFIGATSAAATRCAKGVARAVTDRLHRQAALERREPPATNDEITAQHRRLVEQITRELATSYVESTRNLREPAAQLVADSAASLNIDSNIDEIVAHTLRTESVSEAFRGHAYRLLDGWWNDHKGKRRVLEALDTLLAAVPAAIAAPISIYSGGVGMAEAVVVAGPFVEQFVARVIEYQFGDA
ncbi:MAG TPA: hypothetical protein HPP77_04435, partial [Candidatus Hydrogenedentes bacterium]|nr:hypothetical protein [Candidatus Hydrogenedentota bacterium]